MNNTSRTARSCEANKPPKQTSRDGSGPQGVPGSLSNQPPTPGTALPPNASNSLAAQAAAGGQCAKTQGQAAAERSSAQRPRQHLAAGHTQLRNRSDHGVHEDACGPAAATHSCCAHRQSACRRKGWEGHDDATHARAARPRHPAREGRPSASTPTRGDSVNVVNSPFLEDAAAGRMAQLEVDPALGTAVGARTSRRSSRASSSCWCSCSRC